MSKKKEPVKLGTPYGDRVLVVPDVAEETTSFGIIVPDSGKEKPLQGTVVAVGEGKLDDKGVAIPIRVKVGDVIKFDNYGFEDISIGGKDYYLVKEPSITYIFP